MHDQPPIARIGTIQGKQSVLLYFYPSVGYRYLGPALRWIRRAARPLVTSPARTIGLCLSEARPLVLAMFGLRFAAGAALGWPEVGGNLVRTCATALVWELAVCFVYLFNGVTDVAEDRTNGSTRPIARGALDPATALGVASGTALLAAAGGLAIGGQTAWLVPLLLMFGLLYSGPPCYLKRRSASTAAIGISGSLLSYIAGLTSPAPGTTPYTTAWVIFAIGASAWTGLIGTLAKDLPDVTGDRAAGRNSAVAHLGDRQARFALSGTALITAIAFNLVDFTMNNSLNACAAAMLIGAITLAIAAHSPRSRGSRHNRRLPYRVFMLTQYATHICVLTPFLLAGLAVQ